MKREPEHQNLKERHQKGATLGGLLAFRWEVQPACGNSLGGGVDKYPDHTLLHPCS